MNHPSALDWSSPTPATSEQMQLIAEILLCWGAYEASIYLAVCDLMPMSPDDRRLLIVPLNDKRKRELISKKCKSKKDWLLIRPILAEVDHAAEKWKSERNIIAHGIIMHDQLGNPSLVSLASAAEIDLYKLDVALARAEYAKRAAVTLLLTIGGQTPTALPKRPA